jgi:hypothetical protein
MINRIAGISTKQKHSPNGSEPRRSSFSGQDLKQFIEPIEDIIVKNPTAAIAAAFVVGVAFAWWIKRSK